MVNGLTCKKSETKLLSLEIMEKAEKIGNNIVNKTGIQEIQRLLEPAVQQFLILDWSEFVLY